MLHGRFSDPWFCTPVNRSDTEEETQTNVQKKKVTPPYRKAITSVSCATTWPPSAILMTLYIHIHIPRTHAHTPLAFYYLQVYMQGNIQAITHPRHVLHEDIEYCFHFHCIKVSHYAIMSKALEYPDPTFNSLCLLHGIVGQEV